MNTPNIFHYSPTNGAFLGIGFADNDPMNKGSWIYPANSTTKRPPPTIPGQIAVYMLGNWEVAEDHRGEKHWRDGKEIVIDWVGPIAGHGLTDAPPPTTGTDVAVWENGAWIVKRNHIGEMWWIGPNEPIQVTELGDPIEWGWLKDNPYVAPVVQEPGTVETYALVEMRIADGEIHGLEQAANIAGGMQLDVGVFWVFFTDPIPADSYMVFPTTRPAAACDIEENDGYIVVSVKDFQGAPLDPERVMLQINRVRI